MKASTRRGAERTAADALRLCEQGKAVARKHFENGKPIIVVTCLLRKTQKSTSWQVRVPPNSAYLFEKFFAAHGLDDGLFPGFNQ
jgi:hypothetical protein